MKDVKVELPKLKKVKNHNYEVSKEVLMFLDNGESLIGVYEQSLGEEIVVGEWFCPAYDKTVYGVTHWKNIPKNPNEKK